MPGKVCETSEAFSFTWTLRAGLGGLESAMVVFRLEAMVLVAGLLGYRFKDLLLCTGHIPVVWQRLVTWQ